MIQLAQLEQQLMWVMACMHVWVCVSVCVSVPLFLFGIIERCQLTCSCCIKVNRSRITRSDFLMIFPFRFSFEFPFGFPFAFPVRHHLWQGFCHASTLSPSATLNLIFKINPMETIAKYSPKIFKLMQCYDFLQIVSNGYREYAAGKQ